MCRSQPQSIGRNKTLYINVKQSFEIVHVCQELQLRKRQSIIVDKVVVSIVQFTIVNDLKYWKLTVLSASIATKVYSKYCV